VARPVIGLVGWAITGRPDTPDLGVADTLLTVVCGVVLAGSLTLLILACWYLRQPRNTPAGATGRVLGQAAREPVMRRRPQG
jgi:hypothetical protein